MHYLWNTLMPKPPNGPLHACAREAEMHYF